MQLYTKILIGLVLGVVVGLVANLLELTWLQAILTAVEPVGTVFIRLITMIVIPLVVASLLVGTASLGDIRKLGRIGGKTVAYYLCTTAVAVSIGLLISQVVQPGARIDPTTRDALAASFSEQAGASLQLAAEKPSVMETLIAMVPSNPFAAAAEGDLLPLIIFTIIFGAAVSLIREDRKKAVLDVFHGINDAVMVVIDWVMKLAPYAVFALIAVVVSDFGMDLLQSLLIYTLTVVAGLLLHAFGTYALVLKFIVKYDPITFYRRIAEAPLVAFSTSSSSATLPITMETAEEDLGISNEVS
ncbi:MAG TPA: dicarboxylate/amino acid:cation symporter, partial [Longimicrobiales bacterium]|nr:dicarboxylate/amino acid:cation symporter [Longimicrobiales bacterium]